MEIFIFTILNNIFKCIKRFIKIRVVKFILLTKNANRSLRFWKIELICRDLILLFMFLWHKLQYHVLLLVVSVSTYLYTIIFLKCFSNLSFQRNVNVGKLETAFRYINKSEKNWFLNFLNLFSFLFFFVFFLIFSLLISQFFWMFLFCFVFFNFFVFSHWFRYCNFLGLNFNFFFSFLFFFVFFNHHSCGPPLLKFL